jgi:subtilisin family serine protease/uncharacterized membrane protein YgcG
MKMRWVGVALLLVVFSAVVMAEIDSDVISSFEEHSSVRVIVTLKDSITETVNSVSIDGVSISPLGATGKVQIGSDSFSVSQLVKKREFTSFNGFAADVSQSGLNKLRKNPAVASVVIDYPVQAELSLSVPFINATKTWRRQMDGINITGAYNTVCVVDTGVDYNHIDLGGCAYTSNLNTAGCGKVPSGYDFVNDDDDPRDDHGHGTHVAGIVGANGTTIGVAPGVRIIPMKVLNSGGGGFSSDVASAIEWCTNNATKFNITIITMSLGGSQNYSTHCDATSEGSIYAAAVNAALAQNISVVASAGNFANYTGVTAPACVNNITSVASSGVDDLLSTFTNTGVITDLVAPGNSIVSTKKGGSTETRSGTSMAAPHVAGAYALLNQYHIAESGMMLDPVVAESTMKQTGINITDTRGGLNNNYTRIDLLNALVFLDDAVPLITFVAPTPDDNNATNAANVTINITSNENLGNVTLEFGLSGNPVNYSMNKSSVAGFLYNFSNLPDGLYSYRVFANDTGNNQNITTARTVRIDTAVPNVTITSPSNGSTITNSTVALNFSVVDSSAVVCTLANGTGENSTVANCVNLTFNAVSGLQTVTIYVNDSAGNVNVTTVSFTLNTPPALTLSEPQNKTYETNVSMELNFTSVDDDLDTVWYNIDHGTNVTVTDNTTFNTTGEGHILYLFANDSLNQVSNRSVHFSVDLNGPIITFVAPTPNNESYNTTNSFTINVTLDENASVVLLDFDNANESMTGGGTNWYVTKTVSDGNYTFRVFANDTFSHQRLSAHRYVHVNTTKSEHDFFTQINNTHNGTGGTLRLFQNGLIADSSNVSVLQNYTLEFNISNVYARVAEFKWLEVNTSGIINMTTTVNTATVAGNFSAAGGVLNQTAWIELNNFVVQNFTPILIFDKIYRVFFYLNGTTDMPNATRITSSCSTGFSNRPCFHIGTANSSVYLRTFSGAGAGDDTESPLLSVSSPAVGASLTSTSVSLDFSASDNVALDQCRYSLNGAGAVTLSDCTSRTITVIEGSNTLVVYANDTSGRENQTAVTFTVTTSSGSGSSPGGGSSGGGGGSSAGSSTSTSRDSRTAVAAASGGEEEEEEEKVNEENDNCVYSFDVSLPPISLVAANSVEGNILYTGSCILSSFRVRVSEDLAGDVHAEIEDGSVESGNAVGLAVSRIGSVRDRLPGLVTGDVIGIGRISGYATRIIENFNATQRIAGAVTIEALRDDEVVASEKVPIEVEVFVMEKAVKPLVMGGGFFGFVMVVMGIIAFIIYRKQKTRGNWKGAIAHVRAQPEKTETPKKKVKVKPVKLNPHKNKKMW